jgi:hypothetical protein
LGNISFIDVIADGGVILAVTVYGALALTEPFFEGWLHRKLAPNIAFQWGWDQFFAPLARSIMLIIFVFLAYPGLFGLRVAPSLGDLLEGDSARLSTLVSGLFFVGFVASLAPRINRNAALVLPIQGCLAGGYVFSRLTAYLGVTTASVWPGLDIFLTMLLVAYFGHKFARVFGTSVGARIDIHQNTRGYDVVVMHVVELLMQIVVVLVFGFGLGRQLAI